MHLSAVQWAVWQVWLNNWLDTKHYNMYALTAWHPASPYKWHFYTMTKEIYSQHPHFPLKLWNKFSYRTNIFYWSVMDSPCHFDPSEQQNENTIYHYLHHSDFLGGAQFHCKNICVLVTHLGSQALGVVLWKHDYSMQNFQVGQLTISLELFLARRNYTKTFANCYMESKSVLKGKQAMIKHQVCKSETILFLLRQILATQPLPATYIYNWSPTFSGKLCFSRRWGPHMLPLSERSLAFVTHQYGDAVWRQRRAHLHFLYTGYVACTVIWELNIGYIQSGGAS